MVPQADLLSFAAVQFRSFNSLGRAAVPSLALVIPHGVPPLPICAVRPGAHSSRCAVRCPGFPQAASASPGVAHVAQWRALGSPCGTKAIQTTWQHLARRSEFLVRVRLVSLRVKRVTCQPMILVGKWRPNDSFKPNPLRGFGCSSKLFNLPDPTIRGGSA